MSEALPSIWAMGAVVDLAQWRSALEAERPAVAQLERVIQQLDVLATERLKGDGHLSSGVETELLAILGALTVGAVEDALSRAEQLARKLASGRHPSRER